MRPIIVGGVEDTETALQLQLRGASAVAISLSPSRWNAFSPSVPMTEAKRLRQALDKARLCVCLNGELPIQPQLEKSSELAPEYHFVDVRDAWKDEAIAIAKAFPAALIVGGLTLDHDDDPNALLEALTEHTDVWKPHGFHITLTPSQRSALKWFRETAGEYDDDVTIDDIVRISDASRIFINADMNGEGQRWFENKVPRVAGWFPWLGQPDHLARTPVTSSLNTVFDVLAAR